MADGHETQRSTPGGRGTGDAHREGPLVHGWPFRAEEAFLPEPAVMGTDRPMGPGWIAVSSDGLTSDEQLTFWIEVGLEAAGAKRRPHGDR